MKKFLFTLISGIMLVPCALISFNSQAAVSDYISDDATSEYSDTAELYANTYTVSGSTITLSVTTGSDIYEVLDDALEEARDTASSSNIITVKVPSGNYNLSSGLHIWSNTTLDLSGVTLTWTGTESGNMLKSGSTGSYAGYDSYNTSSACTGYDGFENITIKGGTFKSNENNEASVIKLFHATNVTVTGTTLISGGGAHQMEVCAINGFYVTNCTFQDHGKDASDTDNDENQEALQLDTPINQDVFQGIVSDGTTFKNVTVTGCTFKNVARGVGTHSLLHGAYHENITISNNTFINVVEECIITLNYLNCVIEDNVITNCGGGIIVQNYKPNKDAIYSSTLDGAKKYSGTFIYNLNTTVSGNTITITYNPTCTNHMGIKVYGVNYSSSFKGSDGYTIPAGNYYISGVTVTDNTIVTSGHGIQLINARNCTISNNSITGANFSSADETKNEKDGITVENGCKNIAVTGNTIKNMTCNGLIVQLNSTVSGITNNKISNCTSRAVQIYNNCSCTGDISGNTISNCSMGGISISTNSTAGDITNNTFTSLSGDSAIKVFSSSTVGKISNNTITDMGTDSTGAYCIAIKITTKSQTGDITSNTINKSSGKYACGRGIHIFDSSKVKGSISNNKINKTYDASITVSTKSSVTGTISKNTITNSAGHGIQILSNSKVGKGITGNTIKKSKKCGISILAIKANLKINSNKISGCTSYPILIETGSTKYKVTVKKNTVTGNKKVAGIKAISGKVLITKNTIKKVTYGVFTDAGVKGKISSNKVKKYTKVKEYAMGSGVKIK